MILRAIAKLSSSKLAQPNYISIKLAFTAHTRPGKYRVFKKNEHLVFLKSLNKKFYFATTS